MSSALGTRCVWLKCFSFLLFPLFDGMCIVLLGPEQDLERLPWLRPASELWTLLRYFVEEVVSDENLVQERHGQWSPRPHGTFFASEISRGLH